MAVQPTKGSDLFADDGAIQKLIDQLKTLNTEYSKAQNQIVEKSKETEQRLNSLTGVTAEQREEIKRLAQGTDAMAKAYKSLDKALDENNQTIKEVQETTKTVNQLRRLEAKINANSADSYNALSAEMSILKLRYKQLTSEQIKNSKEGKDLTKRIKEINDTLKDLDANVGVHTRNVGNYTSALSELPGAFGQVGKGIQGVGVQLKALLANPVVLFLGLISAGLVALSQAFGRSEKGARLLAQGSAFLETVMGKLTVVVDAVITGVETLFASEAVKSVQNFGKELVTSVIFRFAKLNETIGAVGRGMKSLISGDLAGLKKASEEAAVSMAKIFLGPSEAELDTLNKQIEERKKKTDDLKNSFLALENAQFAVRQENRKLTMEAERLTTIQEKQQQIADDTTLSFRQQQAALDAAQKAGEQRGKVELRIAQNNLSLINAEIKLRRSQKQDIQGLLDQQIGAIQAVAQAERDLTLTIANAGRQRREIRRDEFERELDFAIDFYDAQKMQLERQVGNEQLAFEERLKIAEKLIALDKSSFAEQIKLVEGFTGERLNLNELALIEDERIVRERIRQYNLDDVTLGRILEILRERKAATQDIADIERELLALRNKGNDVAALPGFDYGKATEEKVLGRVKEITEKAAKTASNTRKSLADVLKGEASFLELFGIDPNGKEGEALKSSLDFVKQQFQSFADARKRIADQIVADADRQVQAAENELNRQTQLQAAGLANTADTAQQELAIQKKKQEEALAQQRKAAKAQQALQTIEQSGNLATAISKIYAALGFPLGVIAGGALFSAFAIAKIKAASLAKQSFREGGLEFLDGPSHEGGGVNLGVNKGRRMEAEGGEAMMILSKRATRQYKDVLPDIFHSLKTGTFESQFGNLSRASSGIPMIAVQSSNIDTSRMENHLQAIRKTSEERYFTDGRGRTVRVKGNTRTTYDN